MKELLEKYVAKEQEKRVLDARLKEVKEELAEIAGQVLEMFETVGLQNMKLDSGVTIAIRTDVRASIPADMREEAYEQFKSHGLDGLVKEAIHPKTLEAWVREHNDKINGVELPSWAEPYITVYEQTRPTILGLK